MNHHIYLILAHFLWKVWSYYWISIIAVCYLSCRILVLRAPWEEHKGP
jgi:hypothetical protein